MVTRSSTCSDDAQNLGIVLDGDAMLYEPTNLYPIDGNIGARDTVRITLIFVLGCSKL